MARQTYVNQEDLRFSRSYLDNLALGSDLETNATDGEYDFNALRSLLKDAKGTANYYTALLGRNLTELETDLSGLEGKKFLFTCQNITDVTVPASVAANGVLTLAGNAANNETVVIGTKTYTFQTALTDVDGNVLIGATASDSLDNLIAAITLGAGAGSTYAASMTLHPTATASAGAGDTMNCSAKVPGTVGNTLASTETLANGSWTAATLINGSGDMVVLSAASSETPSEVAAVTAAQDGAVVAVLAGDVGSHSLAETAGPSAINPRNLVLLRNAATDEPIIDTATGREIKGLLQAENGVVDGNAFDDATKQVQISFVVETSGGSHDLAAVSAAQIGGLDINYAYRCRAALDNLPEYAFLAGNFLDVVGAIDVTLNNALDNQVGLATQVQSVDWDIADTFEFAFTADAGATDLFKLAPNAGGNTLLLNVDTLDVNLTNDADFNQGAKFDTGGTPIHVGVTAGVIESTGANDLELQAANELLFDDGYRGSSTYSIPMRLADSAQEWSDFETEYGAEVSLLSAITAAAQSGGALVYGVAYVTAATIAPDNNVTGAGGSPNISAQLPDHSALAFTSGRALITKNGVAQWAVDAGGGDGDVYPGVTPANGDLKFTRRLVGGANPDVIQVRLLPA